MSIFWLGGPERKVSPEEIKREMYEDRIFLPGVIHGGEDYVIRVYLNDVCEDDEEEFVVEYLTKYLILKAHTKDPAHGQIFNEILACEAENFACYNDGNGDFPELIDAWPESIVMSNSDLVAWAEGKLERCPHCGKRRFSAYGSPATVQCLECGKKIDEPQASRIVNILNDQVNHSKEHTHKDGLEYDPVKTADTDANYLIKRDELMEFLGQIIDIFEDFLEEKGIDIPNEEKTDSENPAIIYGTDYGTLQSEIEETLINWNLVERD